MGMSDYFTSLSEANDKLTAMAVRLLDGLNVPERSNDEVGRENNELAWDIFTKTGKDWDAVSETVAQIVDGWVPFTESIIDSSGSLAHTLGLSMAAVDYNANLLNLELKGLVKDPKYIPCVAKVDVVDDVCIDVTMREAA
jgi:hypothetical protein